VRFTGDWVPVAASDKTFGRYAERSDTKGASVELDFCGTSVGLVHQAGGLGWEWGVITPDTGRALGLAEVRIDGGPPVEIDTSRDGHTLLAKGLPAGRHRVVVTNLGASRSPGGSGTIVVKGFWVDAGEIPDDTVRRAWLAADAVRGGEGWRARAAERAAAVKTADDLRRLEDLVAASRDMEAAAEKLRALTADPPASPMAERERRYWTPNGETQAYLARLAALRKEADAPLAKADAFRYDEADRAPFAGVMAELRRCADRVDAFFQEEVRRLPPILFFTGSPLKSGAAPNHIWQSQPLGNTWGCSIRTWDPAHPDRPAKVLFEEADSAIYDLNLSYDARTVFFSMRRGRAQ